MFTYWKMKKNEWKIRTMFYTTLLAIINNQKDVLGLAQKMYIALKDVPAEELHTEFINKLAEIIHEENKDKAE